MTPDEFVFEYLKADQDTGAGSLEKMTSAITFDWEPVKAAIIKLKYFYFLRTSYWLIISAEVKRRAGWKCSCGGREGLQVHHTDNSHHGEEHLFLDTLKCVCDKCHQKIHPQAAVKDAEKKRQRDNRKEAILAQLPEYPQRISEEAITGSSVSLTRKLLEELEHERKVVIDRTLYEGWQVHRQ
jgi:hypothetical protein